MTTLSVRVFCPDEFIETIKNCIRDDADDIVQHKYTIVKSKGDWVWINVYKVSLYDLKEMEARIQGIADGITYEYRNKI